MGGPEVERLIGLLAKLPGLGPRSARRAALKLLQQPEARMLPLAQALVEAARRSGPAGICGNLDSHDPCGICADPDRDHTLICVVEGVGDLWAIERAGCASRPLPCARRHAVAARRYRPRGPERDALS